MLLCADADAASADLASGVLACPSCGTGRLRPWGSGRERVIRRRDGTRTRQPAGAVRLVPSDARPAAVLVRAPARGCRRGDRVGGRGGGAARDGHRADRRAAGRPGRGRAGWLRRLRARAVAMRQDAMTIFGRITGGVTRRTRSRPARRWATRCPPSPPARTPRWPSTAAPRRTGSPCWACSAWPASSPPRSAADPRAPAQAPSCPRPGRDAHHEHPGPSMPYAVTIMSIPPTP